MANASSSVSVATVAEDSLGKKRASLFEALRQLPSIIVALSGGADSAYLAWAAHETLREKALSVTALSASFSEHDRQQVEAFLVSKPLNHIFIETEELDDPRYAANNADRCYFCKDELFRALDQLAADRGCAAVAYGINADDLSDFRPGQRAATEHRVRTPLLDAGLSKVEIRELSRREGLPTWDRPASACLASRIPHGTSVTREVLKRVERGEAILRELGFRQFRLRHHDALARIEIAPDELPNALNTQMASTLAARFKQLGYQFVTLDLEGYRQGSMNPRNSNSSVELPTEPNTSKIRILK